MERILNHLKSSIWRVYSDVRNQHYINSYETGVARFIASQYDTGGDIGGGILWEDEREEKNREQKGHGLSKGDPSKGNMFYEEGREREQFEGLRRMDTSNFNPPVVQIGGVEVGREEGGGEESNIGKRTPSNLGSVKKSKEKKGSSRSESKKKGKTPSKETENEKVAPFNL